MLVYSFQSIYSFLFISLYLSKSIRIYLSIVGIWHEDTSLVFGTEIHRWYLVRRYIVGIWHRYTSLVFGTEIHRWYLARRFIVGIWHGNTSLVFGTEIHRWYLARRYIVGIWYGYTSLVFGTEIHRWYLARTGSMSVRTGSMSKTVTFKTFQFGISTQFKCKYSLFVKKISISSYSA